MTLLITGATGLVGQSLVRHLLATSSSQDHQSIQLLVRKKQREEHKQRFLDWCQEQGIEVFYGDLTKIMSVMGFVSVPDPEQTILIHCGAIFNMWQPYQEIHEVNVKGTKHILDAFDFYGIKKLIHISSVAVYRELVGPEGEPITEDGHIDISMNASYELSKALGESLVWEYINHHPDRLVTILRPAAITGGPGTTLDMFARMLMTPYTPLPRGGKDKISLVDALDVARAIAHFADFNDITRGTGEAFNLVSAAPSLSEFIETLGQALQKEKVKILSVPLILFKPARIIAWLVRKFRKPKENSLLLPVLFEKLGKDILIDGHKVQSRGFQYQISMSESMAKYGEFLTTHPQYAKQKLSLAL